MPPSTFSRLAGLAYFGIIVSGLSSELILRAPIAMADDPARLLFERAMVWRLSLAADLAMATLDVALALMLFDLFRQFGPALARASLVLRLVQMAIIMSQLPLLVSALGADDPAPLINRHGMGYDIGLWFFGLNSLVMAVLLRRVGARWLSALIAVSGLVYLLGTFTRLLLPDLNAVFQPAYGIAVIAETTLAIWLLRAPAALVRAA